MKWFIFRVFGFVPDKLFARIVFFLKMKYLLNLENPESFNEKITFLKLNSNSKLRVIAVDRLKVREYVKTRSQDVKLIDLLWSGAEFKELDYKNLPQKFVVKANHGSGMVLVADKEKHSYLFIAKLIKKWNSIEYGKLTREPLYTKLPKTTVIEGFLSFGTEVPPDYKFTCINGKVELVQVDLDRFSGHKRNLYTPSFERIKNATAYKEGDDLIQPFGFDVAKKIAEELSIDFDFIRVDLFLLDDGIYFGELTNFPHNGMEPYSRWLDFELGKKLELN